MDSFDRMFTMNGQPFQNIPTENILIHCGPLKCVETLVWVSQKRIQFQRAGEMNEFKPFVSFPKKKICPERFFIDWFSSINRLDFSLNWKRFILYLVNSLLFEQRKLMLQYWLPITIVRLFTLLYNLSAI